MAWIVPLVEAGIDGDDQATDIMEIAKPDDPREIANLHLSRTRHSSMAVNDVRDTFEQFAERHVR